MTRNTNQLTTKTGKAVISKTTGLPQFSTSVDHRIKKVKAQLNDGLTKFEIVWHNITRDAAHLTV